MSGRRRGVGAGLAAAVVASRARAGLEEAPPGGPAAWLRTNHRGEPISLLEGPAVAIGLLGGFLVSGERPRTVVAAGLATATGAALGIVDDLAEKPEGKRKGLRGHLGALAQGEVTTGGIKLVGIGAGALLAAAVGTRRTGSLAGWAGDVVVNGALIAASANLVNLLDLRPGRAIKATMLGAGVAGLAGAAPGLAGVVVGAAGAAFEADLAERDMLGDGGANALGAAAGTVVALGAPRAVRLGALAATVALNLASERVSFTQVIARAPGLRELDALGRRP